MAEHTAGEWAVDETEPTNVFIPGKYEGVVFVAYGGTKANARLIAAAPKLLKRLSEMVDAIAKGAVELNSAEIDVGDPDIPPHPWHEEWAHNARAAIAKALSNA